MEPLQKIVLTASAQPCSCCSTESWMEVQILRPGPSAKKRGIQPAPSYSLHMGPRDMLGWALPRARCPARCPALSRARDAAGRYQYICLPQGLRYAHVSTSLHYVKGSFDWLQFIRSYMVTWITVVIHLLTV